MLPKEGGAYPSYPLFLRFKGVILLITRWRIDANGKTYAVFYDDKSEFVKKIEVKKAIEQFMEEISILCDKNRCHISVILPGRKR